MTLEDKIKKIFADSWKLFSDKFVVLILGTLVAMLLMIFIVTIPPLIYGIYYLAFQVINKKKAKVSDVFEGFNYFFKSWGLFIIMILGIGIGLILLIIPGLLLIVMWQYSFAIMVSEKKGVMDSLNKSYDIAKKNFAFSLVLLIFISIIGFLGSLIKIVSIATVPFTALAICFAIKSLAKSKKK